MYVYGSCSPCTKWNGNLINYVVPVIPLRGRLKGTNVCSENTIATVRCSICRLYKLFLFSLCVYIRDDTSFHYHPWGSSGSEFLECLTVCTYGWDASSRWTGGDVPAVSDVQCPHPPVFSLSVPVRQEGGRGGPVGRTYPSTPLGKGPGVQPQTRLNKRRLWQPDRSRLLSVVLFIGPPKISPRVLGGFQVTAVTRCRLCSPRRWRPSSPLTSTSLFGTYSWSSDIEQKVF